jgi:hypothetical protein
MSKTAKYALLGSGALVLFLLLRNNSTGISIPGFSVTPVSTTASSVAAAGTAAGGILSGLRGLFGPGPSPTTLSSGSTTNANDNLTQSQALAAGAASYEGDPVDAELNTYLGSLD